MYASPKSKWGVKCRDFNAQMDVWLPLNSNFKSNTTHFATEFMSVHERAEFPFHIPDCYMIFAQNTLTKVVNHHYGKGV